MDLTSMFTGMFRMVVTIMCAGFIDFLTMHVMFMAIAGI